MRWPCLQLSANAIVLMLRGHISNYIHALLHNLKLYRFWLAQRRWGILLLLA